MQDPLIICLKTENKEIIGVWVYDKTEQEQLIETIENIINSDKNGTENNAEPQVSTTSNLPLFFIFVNFFSVIFYKLQNDNRFIDLLSGKSRDGIPMATFGRMSSSSVPAGFPAEMYPPNMFPFNGFPPGPRPGPFAPVSHPPGPLPFPPGMFPAVYPNKLSNPNPNFPSAPSGPNFPSANFGSAPMNFTHGPNNPHPNALFPHPPATYGNAPTASDLHSIESQFHLPPHSAGKHVFSPQLPPASDILKNSITNLLNPTEILSKSGLLTPTSISNNRSSNSIPLNLANGGLLNPEKLQANIYDSHKITPTHIRNALLRLANNDIFINTLYQELMRDFS